MERRADRPQSNPSPGNEADSSSLARGMAPRLFGSLRDALFAASRSEQEMRSSDPNQLASGPLDRESFDTGRAEPELPGGRPTPEQPEPTPQAAAAVALPASPRPAPVALQVPATPPAHEQSSMKPPAAADRVPVGAEQLPSADEITAQLDRARAKSALQAGSAAAPPQRTQLVRGRGPLAKSEFQQDPVVGWLVVVGGAGLGSFRPIFEGNNSIGRSRNNRIPIDFGDDAISNEEQAYIRYDGNDRSFLFVPNMSKTNVVSVNSKRPTSAVQLNAMDVVTMGRTQLAFVPFCGPEFDWSEI